MSKERKASRRQMIREERRKKEQRQRIITIVAIVAVAVLIIGALAAPSIREATAPVGEFVEITPVAREFANGTSMGDPNASVKIEVFEDFKCAACQTYTVNVEPAIIENMINTGQVHYVFYQYPFLDDGSAVKESDTAAMASLCAADQDRFWDYHDMLYANMNHVVGEYSTKRLVAFADSLGLDSGQFEQCLGDKIYQDRITQEVALGNSMGVTGTPSVYVNGEQIAPGYVPSYDQIKAAVDAALGSGSN